MSATVAASILAAENLRSDPGNPWANLIVLILFIALLYVLGKDYFR